MSDIFEEKTLVSLELPKRILVCIIAALIPGGGHFLLKRYWRGLLFSFCIYVMAVLGILMHGHLYSFSDTDRLSYLFFFSDLGIGVLYWLFYLLGIGQKILSVLPTFEYGNNFIAVAGLLNYLIILDAFDIASGKKQ